MHTKKQHIVRKTIIVSVSFLLGIVSTVIAAATYDANIQTRATKMFNTIKSNASTLATADQQAYYTLVHLNIQSLIQVLTSVDSSLMLELGSTPDIEDDTVIDQITNTGTTTGTSTATSTTNTSQSGSSQAGTTTSSSSGSTSEQRITLNVPSGMLACGNPERNDYTTYSPVDRKVIIQKDYCNSKGGYVWVVCSGKVTNTKSVNAISNNDTFSCPVVTTSNTTNNPPVTPTSNTNTFSISASHTNNNSIKVDYNIPASTGYKTCVITAGTTAEMITISNGSTVTGNGMSSGLGSSEVGFSGSKYYGMENDLYLNLYCGKMINAKYTELEKVITTTRLGSLVTAPISNISVSRIPGNTAPVTPGTTTTPTTNTGTSTYIATSFELSVLEAKVGDTIDLKYSISTDRTCDVYALKNNLILKDDLPAGTSGVIKYDIKSTDINTTTGFVDFEMKCTNGSTKTRQVKIVSTSGTTNPNVDQMTTINISNFSRVVEYYMCGNKEKDANGDIKGLRSTATYKKDKWTEDARPIGWNNATYTACKLTCQSPSSSYGTLCGDTKIIQSTEDATKEVSKNVLFAEVTKQQVKAGGESITFYGNFPLGSQCKMDYSSVSGGGTQGVLYEVSQQLFVKSGSYVKITCNGTVFKDFKFTEEGGTASTTPPGTIPVPSITASKTTATAGETITFTWVANDPAPVNCKTIINNVTQEPPYLQGASGTIPVANVPAGTYAIKIECKYTSGHVRTSSVVNVVVTTPPVAYMNIVNGGGISACNKQIFDKFGTQRYSCSIGGGCALNGQPKTSTNPSANPNLPGVCIPKSEWDAATPTTTTTTPTTTTTNSNAFSISASRTATNTIKVDYNIPASTGYKTCVITAGTSVDMLTITNGSVTTGNGMSSGLGSSDVGFNGSKYYGVENDLYLNLYCAKVMNAKYSELEKVITATRLSSIVTTPISNVAVSQIPGNTTVATASTTTIPVPTITANKTTATAGDTVTFTWAANDPSPLFCRTITNNVTQTEPYLQGASGTIPVSDVPVGSYAIKIECKYSSGYVRTSPVINVLVNPVSGTVASVAPTCNDPVKYYQYYNPDVPADQGLIHWYKYGYKEQRRSCWPAPVSCAAGGPASWGTNCSGSWPTTVSGADALVIDNIAPGIGEYKATCINGSWTNAVFSCH